MVHRIPPTLPLRPCMGNRTVIYNINVTRLAFLTLLHMYCVGIWRNVAME